MIVPGTDVLVVISNYIILFKCLKPKKYSYILLRLRYGGNTAVFYNTCGNFFKELIHLSINMSFLVLKKKSSGTLLQHPNLKLFC